jgi:hypothetical protein
MPQQTEEKLQPRTVLSAAKVDLALVSYVDQNGELVTQFAIIGNHNVVLLDSKEIGVGQERKPAGTATGWLKDGILKAMGREG